jgi:hypothetical protein
MEAGVKNQKRFSCRCIYAQRLRIKMPKRETKARIIDCCVRRPFQFNLPNNSLHNSPRHDQIAVFTHSSIRRTDACWVGVNSG